MRKQLDEQIVLRIAGPLRRELEWQAAREGRPLATYVRRLLIDHATERVLARAAATTKTGEAAA